MPSHLVDLRKSISRGDHEHVLAVCFLPFESDFQLWLCRVQILTSIIIPYRSLLLHGKQSPLVAMIQ